MDPKLREKTKAVFHTILKNCDAQRKNDSFEAEPVNSNSRNSTRRFDPTKRPRHGQK